MNSIKPTKKSSKLSSTTKSKTKTKSLTTTTTTKRKITTTTTPHLKKPTSISTISSKRLLSTTSTDIPPPPPSPPTEAVDFNSPEVTVDSFSSTTPRSPLHTGRSNTYKPQGQQQQNNTNQKQQTQVGFIRKENPNSYHPPIFAARPLKVNVSNLFDARADYKLPGEGHFTLCFEIDNDGQNITQDLDEKSEWMDTHINNEWFDTMMTRYCPQVSKKAKQMKPSNARQGKARKLHKQTKEKNLAYAIRSAIDSTPRFSAFSTALAENKQLYGTYLPQDKDLREYQQSGRGIEKELAMKGQDRDYKTKLLRQINNH